MEIQPESKGFEKKDGALNECFIENIQTAALLSLAQRGLLTKWQLEECRQKLAAYKNEGGVTVDQGGRILQGID